MRCPHCHSEVRPSKKHPGYYLCDNCRKRYPAASVLPDKKSSGHAKASGKSRNSRPNRKRAKRTRKPFYILLAILFLLLLFAVAAYFFGLFDQAARLLGLSGENDDTAKEASNSELTDILYKIGETADINNIRIQVLGYEESAGDELTAPSEGNEFVFVNFEIVNNTEDELTVNNMASFESYCGGYRLDYSPDAFTALATNIDRQKMDGVIAAGGSLNGYVCLEVPVDWQVIEVHYSEDVWSANKVRFTIEKNE